MKMIEKMTMKKLHWNQKRARYLVTLSKMTDDEIDTLWRAMPLNDPRFKDVNREFSKRMKSQLPKQTEETPTIEAKSAVFQIMRDITDMKAFDRFL